MGSGLATVPTPVFFRPTLKHGLHLRIHNSLPILPSLALPGILAPGMPLTGSPFIHPNALGLPEHSPAPGILTIPRPQEIPAPSLGSLPPHLVIKPGPARE
jgi:hypothetical protein